MKKHCQERLKDHADQGSRFVFPILAYDGYFCLISCRSRPSGLVDYEDDDDEDDEDYNPPSREAEGSHESERPSAAVKPKRELTSTSDGSAEETESRKKRKSDKHWSDGGVVFGTGGGNHADEPGKNMPPSADSRCSLTSTANGASGDRQGDEETPDASVERSCPDSAPSPADARQPIASAAPSEVAVSGASVSRTEPFPVR